MGAGLTSPARPSKPSGHHTRAGGRELPTALLVRFKETGTQLATILNRTAEVIHTIADPAEHDRATIQSLRQQLEQQYQDHHRDLAVLRQEAHDERATLTQHHTDQLATLLATTHQASDPTQTKPATATQKTQHRDKIAKR